MKFAIQGEMKGAKINRGWLNITMEEKDCTYHAWLWSLYKGLFLSAIDHLSWCHEWELFFDSQSLIGGLNSNVVHWMWYYFSIRVCLVCIVFWKIEPLNARVCLSILEMT
jgi:hypothetical protein